MGSYYELSSTFVVAFFFDQLINQLIEVLPAGFVTK
jgi:hypothetical protein